MPPLSSLEEWFKTVDVDGNGRLDHKELLQAVASTMPVDYEALEAVLPVIFPESLTVHELLEQASLLEQLEASAQELTARPQAPVIDAAIDDEFAEPNFDIDKEGWFNHWDADGSGALEREEVVRALAKSRRSFWLQGTQYEMQAEFARAQLERRLQMRCVVEELWPTVDVDGDGRVTLHEFCRRGGLADLITQRLDAKSCSRRSVQKAARKTWSFNNLRSRSLDFDDGDQIDLSRTVTDLPTYHDLLDSPMLMRRPSKGFADERKGASKRRTIAQWANADDNLNRYAKVDNLAATGPDVVGLDTPPWSDDEVEDGEIEEGEIEEPMSFPNLPFAAVESEYIASPFDTVQSSYTAGPFDTVQSSCSVGRFETARSSNADNPFDSIRSFFSDDMSRSLPFETCASMGSYELGKRSVVGRSPSGTSSPCKSRRSSKGLS